MRLSFTIVTVCLFFILSVSKSFGQTASENLSKYSISSTYTNQSLQEIFSDIEQSHPVVFFYKEEWLPGTKLTKSFNGVPLNKVLDELVAGTSLSHVAYSDNAVIIGRELELVQLEVFSMQQYIAEKNRKEDQSGNADYERIIVGDSLLRPRPSRATLSGNIFNNDSEEGIVGTRISVPALQKGTLGDPEGKFSIELPTGTHFVTIEAPGHELVRKEVQIFSDGSWDVPMAYSAYQLDEVLLEAESQTDNVTGSQIGKISLSMVDIKRLPSLLGEADIINNILLLPGVSTVGESASGFNVRGGNIDQNLIMQEGNMIFNSSHLLGFFSIFNPDVVSGATLYKGHMPAQYGGRISSVLDVDIMEGSFRKLRGQGTVGLFSSKFALNGPIQKGKSSFVVAGRGAYPNLWTQYFDQQEQIQNSSSYYLDFTAKLTQKIGENTKISAFGYASTDFFRFSEDFGYDWSNLSGGIKFQQILNNSTSLNIGFNAGQFNSSVFNNNDNQGFETQVGVDNYTGDIQLLYSPGRAHNFQIGAQGTYYDLHPLVRTPFGEESIVLPKNFEKDQGLELGFYVNDEWELNPFISLSAGIRVSMFMNMGASTVYDYAEGLPRLVTTIVDSTVYGNGEVINSNVNFEPRISARILLNESNSIKLSYNRVYQYLHLLSNTASATPIDLWQLSNTYFPAQKADNYSIGIFSNFRGGIGIKSISLEGFYRDMSGLVISKDFARLFSSPNIETEVLNAIGEAYGGEFSIQGAIGKFDLNASVSYIRTLRRTVDNVADQTVNRGEWFPADFDTPWNSNISLKYQINSRKFFSANFTYRSGRPVTVPTGGTLEIYPSWVIPTFSDRNTFRIPDYHRLDIAYTFEDGLIRRDRVKTDLTISIYNLYGRNNPFSVFFQKDVNTNEFKAFQLSVLGAMLPFMTYNIRF